MVVSKPHLPFTRLSMLLYGMDTAPYPRQRSASHPTRGANLAQCSGACTSLAPSLLSNQEVFFYQIPKKINIKVPHSSAKSGTTGDSV